MSTQPAVPKAGFDPATLIAAHQAGVWRYLRALGCERSLADDLVQDTFLAVLQKPLEELHPAATAAYLRKVAYNLFITVQRRAGRVVVVADLERLERDWSELAANDNGEALLAALRECLQELGPRARKALEMRFAEKRSRAEIAAELEIGEHGAKNLMQRAKEQLRRCVESKQK